MAETNETEPIQIAKQAAEELGVDKLLPAVYQDALRPAAREVGKKLIVVAKTVGIALAPLELCVWGFDKIKGYLLLKISEKLASKPIEEIQAPDLSLAGPLLLNMRFASEEPYLREMYANLLAAAMHRPSSGKAHPSFLAIIQQISPAEAGILEKIAKGQFVIKYHGTVAYPWDSFESPKTHVQKDWLKFCLGCGFSDPLLANAYLNNLIRLGILVADYQIHSDPFAGPSHMVADSSITVSEYGKMFLDVCVSDE